MLARKTPFSPTLYAWLCSASHAVSCLSCTRGGRDRLMWKISSATFILWNSGGSLSHSGWEIHQNHSSPKGMTPHKTASERSNGWFGWKCCPSGKLSDSPKQLCDERKESETQTRDSNVWKLKSIALWIIKAARYNPLTETVLKMMDLTALFRTQWCLGMRQEEWLRKWRPRRPTVKSLYKDS